MSKAFGNNLRYVRKKAGLKQWQLSIKMNVTAQTVSSWEVGRTEPTKKQMKELCHLLNCDMNDLLRGTDKLNTPQDRALIDAFHDAPDNIQEAIRVLLHINR